MQSPLSTVELALENNKEICTTSKILTTFPRQFYEAFRTQGIGFIVCQRGQFTFTIDDKPYTAQQEETIFLPTENDFRVVSQSDDLEFYLLLYKVEPIRDILGTTVTSMHIYFKIYPYSHHVYHTGKEDDLVHYICLIDATLQADQGAFNSYEQQLLLISVTYQLCSIFQRKMQQTHPSNARRTDVFLQLIQYVDRYYCKERGVEFYADKLCLSPKYLSGLSKNICGYTVQELVFKAIIRHAKTLLKTTHLTIQEISNEFNFPNASSFGTFFKKQTGVSPQKYRDISK